MTMVITFVLMLATVAAMAVGVMFGRKPIAGSCGGLKALGMNVQCEICGGNPEACENQQDRTDGVRDLARDASRGRRTL